MSSELEEMNHVKFNSETAKIINSKKKNIDIYIDIDLMTAVLITSIKLKVWENTGVAFVEDYDED